MNEYELLTLIGELVYTEIDEVEKLEYAKRINGYPNLFTIKLQCGKKYIIT